jgi:hypothetical protein
MNVYVGARRLVKDTFLEGPAGRPDQYACFRPPSICAAAGRPIAQPERRVADSLDEAKAAFRAA